MMKHRRVAVSRLRSTWRLVRKLQGSDQDLSPLMSLSMIWRRPWSAMGTQMSPNWEDQLTLGRTAILKDRGGREE